MSPEKRQITRNRTSYSCQTCRRRKVKCDKQHPVCGTCKKNDEECQYVVEEPTVSSRKAEDPPKANRRKRRLTPSTSDYSNDKNGESGEAPHDSLTDIKHLLDKIDELINRDNFVSQAIFEQKNTFSIQEQNNVPSSTSATKENHLDNKTIDKMRPVSGLTNSNDVKSRLSSGSSTNPIVTDIADKIKDLGQLFGIPVASSNVSRNHDQLQPESLPFGRIVYPVTHDSGADALPDIHETSPRVFPHDEGYVMFRNWLLAVYPVLPVFDAFEVKAKFDAFNHWYLYDLDKGLPNPVEGDMHLICAVSYAGLLTLSERGMQKWWPGASRRAMLAVIRLHFRHSLKRTKVNNRDAVAARLMMRYLDHSRENTAESSSWLIALIRDAQALGLHLHRGNGSQTADIQLNRRLWWELVHLDAMLSTSSGFPPLLHEQYFDQTLPSEVKSHKLGTDEALAYDVFMENNAPNPHTPDDPSAFETSSITSVHYVVARARALYTSAVRDLMSIKNKEPLGSPDVHRMRSLMSKIYADMKSIVERIPTSGKPENSAAQSQILPGQSIAMDHGTLFSETVTMAEIELIVGQNFDLDDRSNMPFLYQVKVSSSVFHKWARIALSAMVDQVFCYMHSSLIKNTKSMVWHVARDLVLTTCHDFFRRYNLLASDIELERFRWTWVPMFQPVHASKIMLVDLCERPFSKEAIKSRALFDQMLALCDPTIGIIGGRMGLTFKAPLEDSGFSVLDVLKQLRAQAWRRAGLDPSVLWTEGDQIQIGCGTPEFLGDAANALHCRKPMNPQALPQSMLSEDEWNHVSSRTAQPFGGLNELIGKIRSSKPAPVVNMASRTNGRTSNVDVSQANQGSHHTSPLGADVNTAAHLMSNTERPPTWTQRQPAGSAQHGTKRSEEEYSPVNTSSARVWQGDQMRPEPLPDMNWDQWDVLFGQHNGLNTHSLDDLDEDLIASTFREP